MSTLEVDMARSKKRHVGDSPESSSYGKRTKINSDNKESRSSSSSSLHNENHMEHDTPDIPLRTEETNSSNAYKSTSEEKDENYNLDHLSELTIINFKKLNEQLKKGQAPLNKEMHEEIKKYLNLMENETSNNKKESKNKTLVAKRSKFQPLQLQFGSTPGESFYVSFYKIHFNSEDERRKICPYKLNNEINLNTGNFLEDIISEGNSSFVVKVKSREQGKLVEKMKTVCNVPCEVKPHDIMNYCRGIIYVHGYSKEDAKQYGAELQEEFPFIVKVENPTFLKSNNDATPLLITFATTVPPQSLDIPGEPYLNRVYPFRNKPMLCKKCFSYGHTKKHCKNQQRCSTCTSISCASLTEKDVPCKSVPKCLHCPQPHKTGDKNCNKEIEEMNIVQIQDSHKVTIQRARQIASPEQQIPVPSTPKFHTEFMLKLEQNNAENSIAKPIPSAKVFSINRCLTTLLGEKPQYLRKTRDGSFRLKIQKQSSSDKITDINTICEYQCSITPVEGAGTVKGIIYTTQYHSTDNSQLISGLKQKPEIADAQEATWIKTNSPTRAFLISFYGNIPSHVRVLGERAYCKVTRHIPSPQLCKRCQQYGHGERACSSATICRKCSQDHHTSTCISTDELCFQCQGPHPAGSRACSAQQYEKEIMKIKTLNNISREKAIAMYVKSPRQSRSINNPSQQSQTPSANKHPNHNGNNRIKTNTVTPVTPPKLDNVSSKATNNNNIFSTQETRPLTSSQEQIVRFAEDSDLPVHEMNESLIHFYTQQSQHDHSDLQQHTFSSQEHMLSTQEESNIHNITQESMDITSIPLPTKTNLNDNKTKQNSNVKALSKKFSTFPIKHQEDKN